MVQIHKGDRAQVSTRLPAPAYAEVKRRAREAGLPMSQWLADALCRGVLDMPELARTAAGEHLPLPV